MNTLPTLKATGSIGSWFANVEGYGHLPVVHKHHFDFKTLTQHHPDIAHALSDDVRARDATKIPDYVEALRTGRYVIMSDDDVTLDANGIAVGFKRKGYIALWEIADFVEDESAEFSWTFRYVRKAAHLK